jgi:hypothetical protein
LSRLVARADAAPVFPFVRGHALGPAAAAPLHRKLSRGGGNADALIRDAKDKARDIGVRFPWLRARLGTQARGYAAVPEHSFEFGLQAIRRGLEASSRDRRHRSRPASRPRAVDAPG